ncbi:hypothetical protein Nepgr_002311 [Nepenthes gracilis]|uniref:Uncharacterized protein n=1 Tax=Nepenthes gracilis TaxID=150966 RepID=A0AAD3P9U0_NEPGR|nr:hypothetical protein Nepgr_002311 [Nepenthes gracilis]
MSRHCPKSQLQLAASAVLLRKLPRELHIRREKKFPVTVPPSSSKPTKKLSFEPIPRGPSHFHHQPSSDPRTLFWTFNFPAV